MLMTYLNLMGNRNLTENGNYTSIIIIIVTKLYYNKHIILFKL